MKDMNVYSDKAVRAAYNCGVIAAQGGFPNISLYNQFHGSHKPLHDAWINGHNSVSSDKT